MFIRNILKQHQFFYHKYSTKKRKIIKIYFIKDFKYTYILKNSWSKNQSLFLGKSLEFEYYDLRSKI